MTNPRILVVDDEASIREVLSRALREAGMKVFLASTIAEGLRLLEKETPDAVVLDLNLPDGSGEALCHKIRQNPKTQGMGVLVLTAQLREGLSVQCLEGGADDYLNKPFGIKEIIARLHALLRRPTIFFTSNSVLAAGPLTLHVGERRVTIQGREAPDFSPKEYGLLLELILHAPKVIDKDTLAKKVWGVSAHDLHERTLDVHIRRIRKKLGPQGVDCLKTIPAIGYKWVHASKSS